MDWYRVVGILGLLGFLVAALLGTAKLTEGLEVRLTYAQGVRTMYPDGREVPVAPKVRIVACGSALKSGPVALVAGDRYFPAPCASAAASRRRIAGIAFVGAILSGCVVFLAERRRRAIPPRTDGSQSIG